jgi:glycosyltransferase involved in cell wall biosynthesis
MTDTPLITIGITCYSEGEWLRECWQSVLEQTDNRWQAVIIMDGGASPETVTIYEELEHPKLQKFRFEENQGPYICRNKAFEMTETPYHFYLDGDDQLLPGAVEAVLQVFEFEPDAGYVSLNWRDLETKAIYKVFREQGISELTSGSNYTGGGAYSVEIWKKLGGFCTDPVLARGLADYDFHLALEEYDIPRVHSGRPLYLYRIGHENKISKKYAEEFYKKIEFIVERHPRLFKNTRLRDKLLARGYIHSAEHFAETGDREEAKRLGELSIKFDPKFRPGAKWIAWTGLPLPRWYKRLKR